MTKLFISALAILSTSAIAQAASLPQGLSCKGVSEDGQTNISVTTNAKHDELEIAFFPVTQNGPSPELVESYPITSDTFSSFPFATVTAERDLRTVDGDLVTFELSINMEAMSFGGGAGKPGTLNETATGLNRRTGKEFTKKSVFGGLSCRLQ